MSAEVFRAGKYLDDPQPKQDGGGFSARVHTVEGTRQPSRVRPIDQPQQGSVHKSTVTEYKPHDTSHAPYSSAHRPAEPNDLGKLKANQAAMLTPRAKRKRKEKG